MYTDDLSDGFFADLPTVCATLGAQPLDLLSVMMAESDVRAGAHNPHGDASGLIQFMPQTLLGLGWTRGHEAFRAELDAQAQLPYVEAYYRPWTGKGLGTAARLYQATFLPATLDLGEDPDVVLCGAAGPYAFAYAANPGFDADHKGTITVADLTAFIQRRCVGPRWAEIVTRAGGGAPAPGPGDVDLLTAGGIQTALTELGYDVGGVDGILGPRSQAAIQQFQADHGLVADGIVGPATRAALQVALQEALQRMP